ncbi:MAG: domain S-box protein [Bacteroidetes bacterium]|jgi:PAS domain S-box-containing protein|nr:domain S-box protein [Bacteroidota bacterium]MDF2453401.1 domain S-box protein [Bacteroidota bacterium]
MSKPLTNNNQINDPNIAIVNAYTLIAVLYCITFFLLFYFVIGGIFLQAVHLAGLISFLVNYAVLKKTDNFKRATNISLATGTCIVISLFATGGWEKTGIIWAFTYLPFALFLSKGKQGVFWMLALLSGFVVVVILQAFKLIPSPYPFITLANFFGAMILFNILFFLFLKAANLTEVQLKESEERFRKVFQLSPSGICLFSAENFQIIDINKTYLKMIGYQYEDIIGKSALEIGYMTYDDHEIIKDTFIKHGTLDNYEFTFTKKTGEKGTAIFSLDPIVINGKPCMISVVYDISKRLEAEEQKSKLLLDLEKVNSELESFSYSVSHDLRAPLRTISGYTYILEKNHGDNINDDGKSLMLLIKKETLRMGQLIDDLLSFSRLGKGEIQKTPIEIKDLVDSVLLDFSDTGLSNKKIENGSRKIVIHDLLPGFGDSALLRQVFVNLISNAIKFSRKKDHPVIEIGSFSEDSENVYYVKDNGVGFNMLYYDKLFKVFQRLHGQEEFEGTGIGLAIISKIISRHGGRVWAEGKVDGGAAFYFSLPKP